MFVIFIALIVLVIAVGAIYLILKSMGEEGIEVAAPGSCKSGRCGVRCAPEANKADEVPEKMPEDADGVPRKDVV